MKTRTVRKIENRFKGEELSFDLLLREEVFLVTFLDNLLTQLEVYIPKYINSKSIADDITRYRENARKPELKIVLLRQNIGFNWTKKSPTFVGPYVMFRLLKSGSWS
ncbi:MAG: hypothetical protein GKR93_06090 [Gammaproteobacteria bacterium]|nr:hypothetical protein [Gammaproteobacteria bacterium]